ncbi:hypothetical protein [Caulobacter endophyticus]|uniref:Uncharacterized protein n=1 Tax=Caulobacter endophyticus TaxID=2172652 RepID=A0A2T9K301_9CAUL|nr:hypothetical protein [Caulobacter endophyticus]PVM90327.1 hypothetical protein DDF67_10395 [Caulobacter endophyticus]
MKFRFSTRVTCPSCGVDGQTFSASQCLTRTCSISCIGCKKTITSKLSLVEYLALVVYIHVLTIALGATLLFSLLSGNWFVAAAAAALFFFLVIPPAQIWHANRAR